MGPEVRFTPTQQLLTYPDALSIIGVEKHQVLNPNDPAVVRTALLNNGADISLYYPPHKTVEQLYNEITNRDCILTQTAGNKNEKELLRHVRAGRLHVMAMIDNQIRYLIEQRQDFIDEIGVVVNSRQRSAECSLAEKSWKLTHTDLAAKALAEELKITLDTVQLSYLGRVVDRKLSPSYPGLNSIYHYEDFACVIPLGHYDPKGYIEKQRDKITYFVWVSADKLGVQKRGQVVSAYASCTAEPHSSLVLPTPQTLPSPNNLNSDTRRGNSLTGHN